MTAARIIEARDREAVKAWKALAGYKFWMFGYHAAGWVKYNHLLERADRAPNPFSALVKLARTNLED